ncbi:MAG: guanylate kinase [Proteobacteria bacterium]|nr:guanylate kinase [Pseudomonadota bacterium]
MLNASLSSSTFSIQRRGIMFILSSPSGAGKSSISRALLSSVKNLKMSVSMTTRPKRPKEIHGLDYDFADIETFSKMISENKFLEYAKVFGHYYGTPQAPIADSLACGQDVLFDIDWQGTQQIAQHSRGDMVSIFVLPPSTAELEKRLKTRAQDSDDVVAKRMEKAADEMSHWAEYDYVIINEDLDHSIEAVKSIIQGERFRKSRQVGLSNFVKDLRSGK